MVGKRAGRQHTLGASGGRFTDNTINNTTDMGKQHVFRIIFHVYMSVDSMLCKHT